MVTSRKRFDGFRRYYGPYKQAVFKTDAELNQNKMD